MTLHHDTTSLSSSPCDLLACSRLVRVGGLGGPVTAREQAPCTRIFQISFCIIYIFKDFIYLFFEREEGREKERERNMDWLLLTHP